jgi:hypothetical protein
MKRFGDVGEHFNLWKCGTTSVGIDRATRPQTNDILRKSAKNPSERKNQRISKIALPETESIRLLLSYSVYKPVNITSNPFQWELHKEDLFCAPLQYSLVKG